MQGGNARSRGAALARIGCRSPEQVQSPIAAAATISAERLSALDGIGYGLPMVVPVMLLASLAVAGSAAATENGSSTQATVPVQCEAVEPGRELDGKPVTGVTLVAGVVTGMSRMEAKRVAPRMVSGRERIELIPGLSLLGRILFSGWSPSIVSMIEFTGPPTRSPVEALTARFGRPLEIDAGEMMYEFPGAALPLDHRPRVVERFRKLRWCDGARLFLLDINDDEFVLRIMGPREER